ncbi:formyltetrahydrofolate deformylase [Fodinisporobacter ferrooxydans]|uniref:Formyltetrahydrofolate deformylase n=1 Tax=Fodinisporobacter ferrooxydans TaxID=2901836 RepID=A0ABY4CMB7_9BACL|nr:formyltetrahydrofolate deformylase [Alicyclobacillaceae bacterium MYW30-H2]
MIVSNTHTHVSNVPAKERAHSRTYSFVHGNHQANRARLLISCPDQPGIVAHVSQFLYEQGANIVHSNQYSTDPESGLFFMRVEFDIPDLDTHKNTLHNQFQPIAEKFAMDWKLSLANQRKRMAIFVSKEEHCLRELLWQWQNGDLYAEIPVIISNHPIAKKTVESLGVPFFHIPVTRDTKAEAERQQLKILEQYQVDFVVLARYMQILSSNFNQIYKNQIINIHHSFLPAFIGSNPYARAYERGVKLIGATAHYVTENLDEGPIIEQDVQRVTHQYDIEELKRIGAQIERTVLARAVSWHLEDRILIHQNKTIVFE